MRSGYVESINIRSGTVEVTGGSTSVSFEEAMENAPAVILTPTSAGQAGHVPAASTETTGFTAEGDNGVYHYVAIDESRY